MTQPSIQSVRDALIAPPATAFDLSARDSGDRTLFEDKKDAKASLKTYPGGHPFHPLQGVLLQKIEDDHVANMEAKYGGQ